MVKGVRVRLEELAEITPGPSGSLLGKLGDEPGGVPVITPTDITEQGRVDTRALRMLPHEEAARLDRFALREADIVIVRQGSLGRMALIYPGMKGWLYNSSCARLRVRSRQVVSDYLQLYLASPTAREEMARRALPGTVQSLNAKILGDLPVVLPTLDQQCEIVGVITNIDELTAVHRKTANRLDVLKRAVLDNFLGKE